MADSTRIEEIVSAAAVKAFDDLKLKVDASAASVEELVRKAVALNTALGGAKTPKEFYSTIKQVENAEQSLLNSTRALAAEQAKLGNATALQEQKRAINELIIRNKELSNQLKEQAVARKAEADAEKAASAQRKIDLQNEKIANEEKIAIYKAEQEQLDILTQKQTALDRAEEARLSNAAVASQPQAGQVAPQASSVSFTPSTEIQKSAALVRSYEASLAGVRAEQARVNAALKAGTITQSQADAQLNKLIIDESRYKIALSQAQSALTAANKSNEFAKGSLLQRQAALDRLNKTYANLSPIERNTAAGQRQLGIIQRLTTQVKELEQTTDRYQRSVGKYPEVAGGFTKIGNAASKAFGVVRQLAYLIPGVGIAGLFGLAIDPIARFIDKTFGASEASRKAAAALEAEKEALEGLIDGFRDRNALTDSANGGTAAEISRVETLGKVVLDVTASQKERNRALQELEGINKNYFKGLTTEKDGLEAVKKALDEYTQAFVLQAIIKEVESDIGKIGAAYFKQARAVKAATLEVITNDQVQKKSNEDFLKNNARGFVLDQTSAASAKLTQNLKKQQAAAKPLADQYNELNNFLKDLQLEALNFKPLTGGEDKAKAQGTKLNAIKKEFDDQGAQLEADALKQIAKNDDYYLSLRVKNREKAYNLEEDLRQRLLDFNIQAIKAERDASIEGETRKGKGADKNAILNAENKFNFEKEKLEGESGKRMVALAVEEADDLAFIRNSAHVKQLAEDKEQRKKDLEYFDAQAAANEKKITERLQRRTSNINFDKDAQLAIINAEEQKNLAAAAGETERIKIQDAANKKRLSVQNTADIALIKVALDTQESLLKIQRDLNPGDSVAIDALLAKITELRKQLSELNKTKGQIKIDADTKPLDDLLGTLDKIKEKALAVFDIIGGAINASVTAQKNALQDQADEVDRNSKKQIDAINASADTEEKKAARVQLVQAQTQAQKELIAQRQRQLDQRNAEFEKARTIAEIILNTAAAVVKGIKTGGPVLGLLYGALGAAQLAVAIATPVPRFEYGTMDAPGGLAQVNEKRKELIVTPDGRLIETPGTPVVMNVPKHSIVLPDSRAVLEGGIGKRELVGMQRGENSSQLSYLLGGKLDKLTNVIKNKTENHWKRRGSGWDLIKKSGSNSTRYL